eukprot:Sspe_Gene.112355::Locus_95347_Transcript_1_1_Confidence_1.000_Length_676::g.112355::m.112355
MFATVRALRHAVGVRGMASCPRRVLGVPEGASMAEIKRKYLELARANHPDAGGSDRIMQEVNNAYQALRDGNTSTPKAQPPTHTEENVREAPQGFRPHSWVESADPVSGLSVCRVIRHEGEVKITRVPVAARGLSSPRGKWKWVDPVSDLRKGVVLVSSDTNGDSITHSRTVVLITEVDPKHGITGYVLNQEITDVPGLQGVTGVWSG